MALLRAAALPAEGGPAWLPTHVQVTVVRARGLRCKGGTGKGKAGGSDAYTVIQLGREKYSTSVAEKSGGSPEWREECAFELPPEPGPRAGLLLTVMHRALVGMDRFLGQAVVPLEPARQRGREPDERWHKLHSKAGKKEKERGEILVSIQFTRNNLTASMFDLSMKDKPRSPFGKLKDKVTGKKKYDLESASAIIPSSLGGLDVEDEYEMGGKKAKVKGFFLKNKLRKSSLTQSNTSLGSDSTISSASLSLAANVPEVTKSPSRHSSLSMERSVKDYLPSPKLTHKRAFSDDVSQVSPVLEPKAIQSLKPKNDPVSRSSLCINGSHVYSDEPAPKSPALVPPGSAPLPVPAVPRRQDEGFGFTPLHPDPHEAPWGAGGFERPQQRDEPRFIPSPPSLALQEELKVSTKAVTLSNHLGRARMEESSRLENKPTQAAAPVGFSSDKQPEEARKEEKKPKGGFFHHGGNRSEAGSKGQGEKVGPSVQAAAAGDERSKSSGWFGSKEPKDSPQKPSFPCGPHASPEVAGSFYSSEDCSPSASLRHTDPERESPAKSIGVPVPETTPPSQGDLPPPDTEPAVPPPLSEWDDTFDAFATSRLKPEGKKENFFASLAAEGMAFIDDADAASPTERAAKPAHEKGTQGFEKADSQISGEIPAALRSWTNFSSLDVGANLVSTTQEATVIEDVLSPVSAGSMGRRRKSSTPMVWTAAFGNSVEKDASTALTTGSSTREGGDSDEEESSSAGTNGWMTIATETAPEPSESTQSVAEERVGQDSVFGPRPAFLGDGAFEASNASRAAARVLPRSTFPPELTPETLPGSNVVAVPPRVLAEVAARPLPAPPEVGTELQGAGNEEDTFDIRTSVYRLQASMRLEASESLVKLSSDIRERHVVLSPWTGTHEREEIAAGSAVPPPKPPRWFAAAGVGGDGEEEEEARGPQRGSEEQGEDTERPKADVELPRSCVSSEPSVPASPSPPALGVDIAEAGREFLVSKDAECVDSAARASELGKGDTSLGEDPSEMNETDAAEQFETCASKFSLDGSGQSGAEQSWSQPRLSPQTGPTDSAKWEMASAQEPFPEELSVSGLNPPSKLDLGQPEMFWTALEEQEAAAHPTGLSPRLARGESPPQPQLAWDDGEGQEGHRPEPCAPVAVASPPEEAEQGRPPRSEPEGPWHSADSRIDFKKADFWKPDRAEERHKQEAPSPKNPFTVALSPNSPSNPFVETPPDHSLPAQAVLPEKLDQGDFSFASLHEEALGQGFQPTNPAGHPLAQPPFPHASQPLAFSTPFLVAATNPEQFGFPSPAVFPASRGVPAASSRAATQPCPLPQPGDTQASALVVLPRETQPAEKPLFQQTTSPHPVKPISAAVQEVSAEKKQQHRSSLTSALSNGLEKLRTVTTSSVQPVAPTSHPEKTDSKKLKDPTVLDQSAKYYHLTHDELIQLLLQREMELSKKEEHIHELENYIDQLLVRIMEQSPTLLQIPLGEGNTK
ncbi:PREDICTED: rab11 family-interacting protein 5 isoform X1 [Lepidothrix coronata]|uniref:Rab11 family-interacting protein 5 isoform X1 n=1 Tax=Lepidothrix coronata TaxID=321398 RepID=A0A6J0J2J8_9PASS|nr:PREDICTED: rab11 family-interacting protein 5 isoform X1 [Lepidothrix coronata]